MPRCLPMLTSFFYCFLMGFCSQLRLPEPHGSSPRCSESTIYQKFVFRKSYRFFIDFGTNMLSFSLRKSTKIDLKMIVKGINFLIDSCSDFLLILARFWKPTWRHVGNFFNQNGCTLWCLPLFLPGSMFLSEFLAVLTSLLPKMSRAAPRFWTVLSSILECFGLHFGSSWWLFVRFSVSIFFTIFEST